MQFKKEFISILNRVKRRTHQFMRYIKWIDSEFMLNKAINAGHKRIIQDFVNRSDVSPFKKMQFLASYKTELSKFQKSNQSEQQSKAKKT